MVDKDSNGGQIGRLVQRQESVRLLFRLRTGSAGLLDDKKRYRMFSDERCVMCDSRVVENMAHFHVGCGEFKRDCWWYWMMCTELWVPESGWMNFGEWPRRERWHCCGERWHCCWERRHCCWGKG